MDVFILNTTKANNYSWKEIEFFYWALSFPTEQLDSTSLKPFPMHAFDLNLASQVLTAHH